MGDRLLPHPHALRFRAVHAGGRSGRNAGVSQAAVFDCRTTRTIDDVPENQRRDRVPLYIGGDAVSVRLLVRLALLVAAP